MNCPRSFTRRRVGVAFLMMVSMATGRSAVATIVSTLCAPSADPCIVSTTVAVDDMSVLDLGDRTLRVASGGRLNVGGGTMTILAGAVVVESGGALAGAGSGLLPGGIVNVRAGSVNIVGLVDVAGSPGGQITLAGTGDVSVSGTLDAKASARNQSGGTITVSGTTINLAGTVTAIAGTEDSLGGDVEISARQDLTVSGTITATGPDGGSITLDAGSGASAGNLILENSSQLLADGRNQGGFGGSVDISAAGDGVATGMVRLGGAISVTGNTAGDEIGGGSGGCLSVNATGSVVADNVNATLSVKGGGPDGDGGEMDIVSDASSVVMAAKVDVSTAGDEGGGGALSIDSVGPIVVLGPILATGGDGGEVALISTGAGVIVGELVTIDTTGRVLGSGGAICVESASMPRGTAASVVVNGSLRADGGSTAGQGGAIEIIGFDSARLVGMVTADGGLGGGAGGAVAVTALGGTSFVEGTVNARGRGGSGGSVTVDGDRIEVPGRIDVSGSGGNSSSTDIGLRSSGTIVVGGTLVATGSPGSGGFVEIIAEGDLILAGTLTADGGAMPGGMVTGRGCSVLLCGFNSEPELCQGKTGVMRTMGPNGLNRLTARDGAIVFGTMTTIAAGRNEVIVRPPAAQNATVLGTITPPVILVADANLRPCPICGNRMVEPPESCDDGNTSDGDGCSALCRLEGDFLVGDVNGDFVVNAEDAGFLSREIFDGDGTLVGDISGGSFAGTPGADANGDGRITAADFPDLLRLLVGL